jgi:DNA-binding IclR family transcriptional regulator
MALLSRHSDAKIQKLFPETVAYEETGRVTSAEDIIAQARKIRDAGFVTMTGGTYYGFSAVAAAVESAAERQLIGFSLSCPEELLNEVDIREIEQAVASTAYEVGVRTADSYWLTRKPATLGLTGGQDRKIEEEAGPKSKKSIGRLAGGL